MAIKMMKLAERERLKSLGIEEEDPLLHMQPN